jgi:hypothetical protein
LITHISRFLHPLPDYPAPALFTQLDISAVVGPMGNGKSTQLIALGSLSSNTPQTLDAPQTELAPTCTRSQELSDGIGAAGGSATRMGTEILENRKLNLVMQG